MDNKERLLAEILGEVSAIGKRLDKVLGHEVTGIEIVKGNLEPDGLPSREVETPIVDINASYILEMKKYLDLNEFDHKEKLEPLLWGNINPEQTAWCASAMTGALENVGIDSPKSNLSTDYATWGKECPPETVGAVVVWRGHVGVYLGNNKVMGGNQSNELNIMKINYIRRDKPIAWRIPEGWELPS